MTGETCDVMVAGTGLFAEKIVFSLAMTAAQPITVAVGGRNRERMDWLSLSGNARAALFGRPVRVFAVPLTWNTPSAIAETLAVCRPTVVAQAATVQSPRDLDSPSNPWQRLISRAGGFGATQVLQALLLSRMARALTLAGVEASLLNACYPDAVNAMLAARGEAVICGLGNVAAAAAMIAAALGRTEPGAVKVLAHHQSPSIWRRPPAERRGVAPRVWVDGRELDRVFERLEALRSPLDVRQSIAGVSAAPLIVALLGQDEYVGHAAGPLGLPGGYPVTVRGGELTLDLPAGLGRAEAVAYNRRFAEHDPARLLADGQIVYADEAHRVLAKESPEVAKGFHVSDLDAAAADMLALRQRLGG
ncbi:MAG: hypothetical protein QF830_06340 [Rhodospirillales bacterium]|jgi:hypothetical protein|nr:hypothetical protein [Rhodospirillales bacterium]MDP6883733.1 hypothetical protein [Rhodospirillales bacterium]